MAYAHASGVIHRDLKPANVMVGRFGVVRVMDWGLAKVIEDHHEAPPSLEAGQNGGRGLLRPTLADLNGAGEAESIGSRGRVMGTLAYMSPEQARGEIEHLDKRADVFGLGAMLCEILTGRPPYAGKDAEALYHKAAAADLGEALSRLDSCLADPQLVRLAKHCLRADPEERPGEAGAVAKAVTAQIESDLKRSALDLSRFFELSPDMFCLASLDGYFQRVNENFTRVLGFSKAELVARPFLDFVHPEDLSRTLAQIEKLAQGLPVVRFRNRYRDVGGHYRWFEWTAKSIPEENVIFAIARTDDPDAPPWPEL
jgi:serine/threonine-protein kinase